MINVKVEKSGLRITPAATGKSAASDQNVRTRRIQTFSNEDAIPSHSVVHKEPQRTMHSGVHPQGNAAKNQVANISTVKSAPNQLVLAVQVFLISTARSANQTVARDLLLPHHRCQ